MNRKEFEYIQKVKKYINDNKLISENDYVVIGFSGGGDSVCLLKMIMNLRENMHIDIHAVHVHHGIRGNSADEDELFCRNFCESNNITYEAVYADIPKLSKESGESVEECARRVRYEILRKIAGEHNNSKIAVAHHMDDQAETVLFRIIRGTGVKGLSAMRPQNGDIVRPLLCLSKEEITDYLSLTNERYCTDETNSDDTYSRNRIRLNILPETKSICPEVNSHIADLADEAAELMEFIEKCAERLGREAITADTEGCIRCSISVLEAADKVLVLQLIRKIIEKIIYSLKDITRDHVESVYRLIFESGAKGVDLPKKLRVFRDGQELVFLVGEDEEAGCNTEGEKYCKDINIPGSVILPGGSELSADYDTIDVNDDIPQNVYTKWLDYDKINAGLCIRYKEAGDYLFVDDKGTRKSLSRYMIDEKIPKGQRDKIPLVASGSEIIWIIGHRISARFRVEKNTKTIIRLEVKGEGHE